jgi:PAS domain S-box-containing protein
MNDIEQQYRVLFENMAQGAFYQRPDGKLVDVNPAALEMLGVGREEFLSRSAADGSWRVFLEDGSDLPPDLFPSVVAAREGRSVRDFTLGVFNPRRNAVVWLSVNAVPMVRAGETRPFLVFATLHDISVLKRHEEVHLSRLHLMDFAASHTLDELLVETLDELEVLTGSTIGFYHFVDPDLRHITLKAWSTRTSREFCTVEGQGSHYPVERAGVWGDAVREGKPVIHNDYASLPHRKGMPEGHAKVVRELVVPVLRGGRVVAVLGVGNKARAYGDSDVETVSVFADLVWDIADRMRIDERRREAERLYALLSQTSLDAFVVLSDDGAIRSVNDAACRTYGRSRDELLSMSLSDIEASESPEEIRAHIEKIKTLGYDRFETRHRGPDGRPIDIEVSASYYHEKRQFLDLFRDISERKRNEADLLERERRFRDLFEGMGEGVALHEMVRDASGKAVDYRIVDVNPAFERMVGIGREMVVGKCARDAYGTPDSPFMDEYASVVSSRVLSNFERHFDPLDRTFSVSAIPWAGDGFATIFSDVTERRRADRKLEETKRRLELALASGRFGVWEYDLRKGRLSWDERMFELYGQDPERFTGKISDWERLVHPDDLSAASAGAADALAGTRAYDVEFRVLLPGGGHRHIKADGTVLRDPDGTPTRIIGINRDVTEQRKVEAQFRQAQKMESIGTLAGGVAHDINNLLQVIMGNAALLNMEAVRAGRPADEIVQIIEAVDRGATLTRSLLAFSRKQTLNLKTVDLNDLVCRSAGLARRLVEESIPIRVDSCPGALPVRVDPGLIQQALFNLVTNARDALGHEGLIRIRTCVEEIGQPWTPKGIVFPAPPRAGPLRGLLGGRHGQGHPPRDRRAHLRPVLPGQGARARDGARPVDDPRDRRPARRRDRRRHRPGAGDRGVGLPPARFPHRRGRRRRSRSRGGRGRSGRQPALRDPRRRGRGGGSTGPRKDAFLGGIPGRRRPGREGGRRGVHREKWGVRPRAPRRRHAGDGRAGSARADPGGATGRPGAPAERLRVRVPRAAREGGGGGGNPFQARGPSLPPGPGRRVDAQRLTAAGSSAFRAPARARGIRPLAPPAAFEAFRRHPWRLILPDRSAASPELERSRQGLDSRSMRAHPPYSVGGRLPSNPPFGLGVFLRAW